MEYVIYIDKPFDPTTDKPKPKRIIITHDQLEVINQFAHQRKDSGLNTYYKLNECEFSIYPLFDSPLKPDVKSTCVCCDEQKPILELCMDCVNKIILGNKENKASNSQEYNDAENIRLKVGYFSCEELQSIKADCSHILTTIHLSSKQAAKRKSIIDKIDKELHQ